tara:strand:+ start:83 stop:265 length:183 start_codon:yes stop_codon:yes gene_type:complete
MLINEKGEKLGLKSIDEALKFAADISMDLVQVSPKASSPVVCKVMDYGKHLFSKKKKYIK